MKRLNDGKDLYKNMNVFCKLYTLWYKQMAGGLINKHWWTWTLVNQKVTFLVWKDAQSPGGIVVHVVVSLSQIKNVVQAWSFKGYQGLEGYLDSDCRQVGIELGKGILSLWDMV